MPFPRWLKPFFCGQLWNLEDLTDTNQVGIVANRILVYSINGFPVVWGAIMLFRDRSQIIAGCHYMFGDEFGPPLVVVMVA